MARHKSHITKTGYRKGVPNANKGKKFPVYTLEREEVHALIDANNCGASGLRDRALIGTGWGTGGRVSELLSLHMADIDFETRAVRINGTKTKNAVRTVGLNNYSLAMVRDWWDVRRDMGIPDTAPLFCCISENEKGNPVRPAQFRQKLHILARKAEIPKRVHPHALRHTFAVELKRAGVDIRIISKALGHSNIAITHIYLDHIDPSEVVEATSGLDLFELTADRYQVQNVVAMVDPFGPPREIAA